MDKEHPYLDDLMTLSSTELEQTLCLLVVVEDQLVKEVELERKILVDLTRRVVGGAVDRVVVGGAVGRDGVVGVPVDVVFRHGISSNRCEVRNNERK